MSKNRSGRSKAKRKIMLDLSSDEESAASGGDETSESEYDANFDLSKYFNG